jgi:polar amino acid transport system substrate-binding protein
VLQYQKNGKIEVVDVPPPECPKEGVLVRTAWSLISAGTEKTSVDNAKGSLVDRARKQPDQVKLVMDTVKKQGVKETVRRVQAKLDSYKQLGYSASGTVVESRCRDFAVGDKVAVGGAGLANHAEYVAIPKNLAVKVPEGISLEDASYATVGSIAMQGFRQANPSLGDTVAVIGLGLIGQMTVQYLRAAGCRVIGLDIDKSLFEQAKKSGCELVLESDKNAVSTILSATDSYGCDSVIITAGTSSSEPLNMSMEICRKRGTVVIVGAVGMDLNRHPFYKKEINLTISASYGPGRYDPEYEERGIDYPLHYVRWTENRNMKAVLDLISQGRLDVNILTTHRYSIGNAEDAYKLVSGDTDEKYLGILLEYPSSEHRSKPDKVISIPIRKKIEGDIGLGVIGAGQFAQNYLLPPLKELKTKPVILSTTTPANANSLGGHFGFAKTTTSGSEVIADKDVSLVVCATRHDSHAQYVLESIKAGKDVFCEKPLCVNEEELQEIIEAKNGSPSRLMVGFNRRFSKPFIDIKEFISKSSQPLNIIYRVNAGAIPSEHWTQQVDQGGRIIGEGCHFIDTMVYLTGSLPQSVVSIAMHGSDKNQPGDNNVSVSIKFADGSVGTLHYISSGDKSVPKEYCEIHSGGLSAVMDNFEKITLYQAGKQTDKTYNGEKGIKAELEALIKSIRNGQPSPISFDEIISVTKATIAAVESIKSQSLISIK